MEISEFLEVPILKSVRFFIFSKPNKHHTSRRRTLLRSNMAFTVYTKWTYLDNGKPWGGGSQWQGYRTQKEAEARVEMLKKKHTTTVMEMMEIEIGSHVDEKWTPVMRLVLSERYKKSDS